MGQKALNFGALADLELLNTLLEDTAGLLEAMRNDLIDYQEDNEARTKRNAELRARMENMKKA